MEKLSESSTVRTIDTLRGPAGPLEALLNSGHADAWQRTVAFFAERLKK